MSFDVSAQFKSGIDTGVLKQVSQEILKRANAKNADFNVNNSAFKTASQARQELGLNLYNGSVDSNTARQIALNNSGLQIQLNQNVLESIKYLNTQAAQRNANNLEGRLTVDVNEITTKVVAPENPTLTQGILSFATDKDKSGSQTPYRGELLQVEKKDEQKVDNIFERVF
ncbi:MAG: hypothetical protein NC390_08450 [Fusobacterium sp.]|nr:hypothetical protein [Fusobacterium sp.]